MRHPFFASRRRLALYLGGWLFVGALLAALVHVLKPRPLEWIVAFTLPLVLVYAFACLSAWWVCRSLPLSPGRPLRLIGMISGTAFMTACFWVSIAGAWDRMLVELLGIPAGLAIVQDYAVLLVAGISLYLLSTVIHYMFLLFEGSRAADRRAYESQVTAREAEVRALRAQLNPHFLFNSLNSINSLVVSSPESARRMCQGLGDFLRQTLSLGARESVTLAEEMTLIDNYLAIEQVRFGPRLTIERATTAEALECHVPPLLLQPLVENAVKHGVADRIEGGVIRLEAVRTGSRLRLEVSNALDPDAPVRRGEGVGIENVRRRLSTLGVGDAGLRVHKDASTFRVTLDLPAVSGNGSGARRPVEGP